MSIKSYSLGQKASIFNTRFLIRVVHTVTKKNNNKINIHIHRETQLFFIHILSLNLV